MNMSQALLKKMELFEDQSTRYSIKHRPKGKSLGIFGPHNCFRQFCKRIVELKYYDYAIMSLIIISTILLILENPLDDQNGDKA